MVKNLQKQPAIQEVKVLDSFYEICGNNHDSSECRQNPETSCYVWNYNMNVTSNTYNPAWRQHPNFSWQNQNNALNPSTANQHGYQGQPRQNQQSNQPRPIGGFPSDTEIAKSATQEKCKVISTRSGKVLNPPTENRKGEATIANSKAASDIDIPASANTPAAADKDHNIPSEPKEAETTSAAPQPRRNTSEEQKLPPPFHQRLKKQKHEYQYKKFFDILK
ncbi:hypothetical protein V6N13_072993 [Hibiscus sabdariffa]|uniref:Uncharacterized protein n=1 Tax=Hibiscus sabdariffa TaxID=183260 RepID=A0ABR2E873_9ROSI